jgi:uncharacterized membrane protein (DUF373 family)
LNVGEDLVLIAVAVILLVAGLVIVVDAARDVFAAMVARNMAEAIFNIVENALLALILAELVHTLLVSLGGGALTVEPFLVVAIVAVLRKLLLVTVLTTKVLESPELFTSVTIELLALGVLILLLGGVLRLVRVRGNRPRADA